MFLQAKERESKNLWYVDSACSRYMTGNRDNFLSLRAYQGGSVGFGNGKKEYTVDIGKIGNFHSYAIENVYYVKDLKYIILSVFQRESGPLHF